MIEPMGPEELQACRERAEGPCVLPGFISRTCERGTNGCGVRHFAADVPRLLATVGALEASLAKLRRNVVAAASYRRDRKAPRWAHVMDATTLGSTSAQELCRLAGFDPDEEIGSWPEPCETCAEGKEADDE